MNYTGLVRMMCAMASCREALWLIPTLIKTTELCFEEVMEGGVASSEGRSSHAGHVCFARAGKEMDPLSGVDTFKPPGMGNTGWNTGSGGRGGMGHLPSDSSTWSMPPAGSTGWPDMQTNPSE